MTIFEIAGRWPGTRHQYAAGRRSRPHGSTPDGAKLRWTREVENPFAVPSRIYRELF